MSASEAKDNTRNANDVGEARVVMVRSSEGGLAQEIIVGPHHLSTDEPELPGTDTGPTPYQLLSAALGACTSITLTAYARRKEWPLESVTVVLTHGKIHAKDCEECETRDGKVDRIERVVTLTGDLSASERTRLLEIADKCPVHRSLHSEVKVRTRLQD